MDPISAKVRKIAFQTIPVLSIFGQQNIIVDTIFLGEASDPGLSLHDPSESLGDGFDFGPVFD